MGIDWLNTILVSVSMSVDCMSIGATDGMSHPELRKTRSVFISFIFGFFQFLMPVIGYFILYFIVKYGLSQEIASEIEKYIPWIAFALLSLMGILKIISWIKEYKEAKEFEEKKKALEEEGLEHKEEPLTIGAIILQGIATSIDALCIGFVYSPLQYDIGPAMLIFGTIGITTFILSFLAIILGKLIGTKIKKWAGLIAGIVFIGVGLKILLEGILG